MPSTLRVYAFEIRVAQKSPHARKSLSRARLDTSIRFFRHTEGRSDSNLLYDSRNAGVASHPGLYPVAYSRKPGFTETRLRPLARRRERTFWPPWVFMRERNPCFLDRLRRLGWNVRLGMKNTCS